MQLKLITSVNRTKKHEIGGLFETDMQKKRIDIPFLYIYIYIRYLTNDNILLKQIKIKQGKDGGREKPLQRS